MWMNDETIIDSGERSRGRGMEKAKWREREREKQIQEKSNIRFTCPSHLTSHVDTRTRRVTKAHFSFGPKALLTIQLNLPLEEAP